MSIGTQMFWGKIFVGCTWIGSGVFGIFDNLVCDILHIICLLSAIIVMVVLMRVDLEEDDEMVKSFAGKMGAFLKRKADVHRRQRCAAATPGSAAGAAGLKAPGAAKQKKSPQGLTQSFLFSSSARRHLLFAASV